MDVVSDSAAVKKAGTKEMYSNDFSGRIDKNRSTEIEDMLWAKVDKREQTLKKQGGENYEAFLQERRAFEEAISLPQNRGLMKPTYKNLPLFCHLAGITVKDLYEEILQKELTWPSEQAKEFYERIRNLPTESQERLLELIKRVTPSFWYAPVSKKRYTPTDRTIAMVKRRVPNEGHAYTAYMKTLPKDVQATWADLKQTTIITLRSFPEMANRLEVSLFWILCPSWDTPLLADSVLEEMLVAGYLFLAKPERVLIDSYMKGEAVL